MTQATSAGRRFFQTFHVNCESAIVAIVFFRPSQRRCRPGRSRVVGRRRRGVAPTMARLGERVRPRLAVESSVGSDHP